MLTGKNNKAKHRNLNYWMSKEKLKNNQLKKKKSLLTNSSVPVRPAEPGAGLTENSVTGLLVCTGGLASWKWGMMEKSPCGGFSWLHSQACAVCSLVHTDGADGASSCEGYFAHWHGPSGLGWLTVIGRKRSKSINKKKKKNSWSQMVWKLLLNWRTVPATKGIFKRLGLPVDSSSFLLDAFCRRQLLPWLCWKQIYLQSTKYKNEVNQLHQ